jgi:signal transduction histidine kinase
MKKHHDQASKHTDIMTRVHDLAWAGKHAQAIILASQELQKADLPLPQRMDLLDLRAESYIAEGKLQSALVDAGSMEELANEAAVGADPGLIAQALNRKAIVQLRMGDLQPALKTVTTALGFSRQTSRNSLIAKGLLILGEAQIPAGQFDGSVQNGQAAATIYEGLNDPSGEGRANWLVALGYSLLGKVEESRRHANKALLLCQQAGDQYGIGNALNVQYATSRDIAVSINTLHRVIQAYRSAGYIERTPIGTGNLANVYETLGLYTHARRLNLENIRICRLTGAKYRLAFMLLNIGTVEIKLGELESARAHLVELTELTRGLGDPLLDAAVAKYRSDLAYEEGNYKEAIRDNKLALKILQENEQGDYGEYYVGLARIYLTSGRPAEALKVTSRAINKYRKQAFVHDDILSAQSLRWWHTKTLIANGQYENVNEALDGAYDFMLESIKSIRDVGLRRNALNKVEANRELIQFWVREGRKRKLPRERLHAYLNIESNTREPFARLTDTSQRLNLLKTIPEIQIFLVDEATELCGGERVLLILEGGEKLQVAESILPKGEAAGGALTSIKKHLTSARLTRTVQLVLPKKEGLSRIVAPLIAQNEIIGYLYADMDTIYGRFDDIDRDMLGMLANQAAVALDNAGLVAGLEHKVQERTAQLQESVNETERLLKESRTLSDVGMDISSSLDIGTVLNNIVRYAKDLLDGELSALFLPDGKEAFRAFAAAGEYAAELQNERIAPGDGILGSIALSKTAEIVNETNHDSRARIITGTETLPHEHLLAIPLLAQDEIKGLMAVWRTGKGREFSEDELVFLQSLSHQVVIALKNAQLFAEAEEARRLAEQADRTKSAFLANMSHELRTPLNAIINFTELVTMETMGPVTEEQQEALGFSLSSSKHLLQLINDVLDISKIQAGKLSLFMEENVDLKVLIDETLTIIEPAMQKQAELFGHQTQLIRDVDPDLPLITCDQRRIKQVLLNLLSNAVKFTEKGSITLSVKRKEEYFLCAVMDTGHGIPLELQTQIFEPFVQTLDGRKHAEGTGLGLPITRSLVESHGGQIWLESELGQGSSFYFTLPFARRSN